MFNVVNVPLIFKIFLNILTFFRLKVCITKVFIHNKSVLSKLSLFQPTCTGAAVSSAPHKKCLSPKDYGHYTVVIIAFDSTESYLFSFPSCC